MSAPLTLAPWQANMTLPATTHPTNMPPPRHQHRFNHSCFFDSCFHLKMTHTTSTVHCSRPNACFAASGQGIQLLLIDAMNGRGFWQHLGMCLCGFVRNEQPDIQCGPATARLVKSQPCKRMPHAVQALMRIRCRVSTGCVIMTCNHTW